jgi:hypothetical protein
MPRPSRACSRAGGASAVLAAHNRVNRVQLAPADDVPDAFPVGVFGTGGSPLEGASMQERGAYHAWQLITVRPEPGARTALGRAPVAIRSIPILESVAVAAPDGRRTGAGSTLRFEGLARTPDLGGSHNQGRAYDPNQSRAGYLRFPAPPRCAPLQRGEPGVCTEAGVAQPDHRFVCEDPEQCAFVREDPDRPGVPFRDDRGRLVADPSSGLMCAFAPGRTFVRLEAGTVAGRMPVSFDGGSGPCIPGTIFVPPEVANPGLVLSESASAESFAPQQPSREGPPQLRPRTSQGAAVGAIVPPIVNTAPVTPGGGTGRQEEHEAASEQAEFSAQRLRTRHETVPTPRRGESLPGVAEGLAVSVVVTALALGAALVARRRRPQAAPAYLSNRHRRNL